MNQLELIKLISVSSPETTLSSAITLSKAIVDNLDGQSLPFEPSEGSSNELGPSPSLADELTPDEKRAIVNGMETPVQKEKRELSEKIIALGGTPPDKGAVAKYREVYIELEESKKIEDMATGSEQIETPEVTVVSLMHEATEKLKKGRAVVTAEEARSFAAVFMHKGDPNKQRNKIKSFLGSINTQSISVATPEQIIEIVKFLEDSTGMTLDEALKEHTKA
ncbi:hypothetical protein OAB00_01360 [Akkermansiaceae bacterium]|nr:hypothetical protein [Akkermansiaceae bacterium]